VLVPTSEVSNYLCVLCAWCSLNLPIKSGLHCAEPPSKTAETYVFCLSRSHFNRFTAAAGTANHYECKQLEELQEFGSVELAIALNFIILYTNIQPPVNSGFPHLVGNTRAAVSLVFLIT